MSYFWLKTVHYCGTPLAGLELKIILRSVGMGEWGDGGVGEWGDGERGLVTELWIAKIS